MSLDKPQQRRLSLSSGKRDAEVSGILLPHPSKGRGEGFVKMTGKVIVGENPTTDPADIRRPNVFGQQLDGSDAVPADGFKK